MSLSGKRLLRGTVADRQRTNEVTRLRFPYANEQLITKF